MNQVQEMFKLNDARRLDEALSRLGGLFDVMAQQPGFLHAEVTRDATDEKTLLVLHAWDRIEDWQTFQTSQWKLDFMAGRPEGLYTPVSIGMNWTLVSGDEAPSGRFVRRVLLHAQPEDVNGQVLSEKGADACDGVRWLTLEHRETASSGDGWFEVLLTRARGVVGVLP